MDLMLFTFPGAPNVCCAFCGRGSGSAGNVSFNAGNDKAAAATRRLALAQRLAALGARAWRECRQVHGDEILIEPAPTEATSESDALEPADGMMTTRPGIALMIKTADCQPIMFAGRSGLQIMAIHAGWRGSRINFPATAAERFCARYGLDPKDVLAVRGPSLGRAEFVNFKSEWGDAWLPWYDAQSKCMDLWQLTRSQLRSAGIPDANIYGIDICTTTNNGDFFSWRRGRETGRQASFIWITPPKKEGT